MSEGPQYPSIAEPVQDLANHQEILKQIKESVELMVGQRGNVREDSLEYRLRSLRKELETPDGLIVTAKVTSLEETFVSNEKATARRIGIVEAEIENARGENMNLGARLETMDQATVDLESASAQRFTEIEAELTDARQGTATLSARLNELSEAIVDGDEAITRQITQFETVSGDIAAKIREIRDTRIDAENAIATIASEALAKSNMGTAGGNLRFQAISNPNTVNAVIDLEVYAGLANPIKSGMRLKAKSGGVGEVEFNTGSFKLFDAASGAALPVFGYSAGKFTLNGNVAINGQLVLNGTIFTEKVAQASMTALFRANSVEGSNFQHASFTTFITVREGARVMVLATVDRNLPYENATGFYTGNQFQQGNVWDLYFGGNYLGSMKMIVFDAYVQDPGAGDFKRPLVVPQCDHFFLGPLPAGTYAFSAVAPLFNVVPIRCTILECAR